MRSKAAREQELASSRVAWAWGVGAAGRPAGGRRRAACVCESDSSAAAGVRLRRRRGWSRRGKQHASHTRADCAKGELAHACRASSSRTCRRRRLRMEKSLEGKKFSSAKLANWLSLCPGQHRQTGRQTDGRIVCGPQVAVYKLSRALTKWATNTRDSGPVRVSWPPSLVCISVEALKKGQRKRAKNPPASAKCQP